MTYGEAHIAEQMSLTLIKGEFTQTVHIDNKPKPMTSEDAGLYYNTKFYNYWLDTLNLELPGKEKINAIWLQVKMFGHPDNTKLLKEI